MSSNVINLSERRKKSAHESQKTDFEKIIEHNKKNDERIERERKIKNKSIKRSHILSTKGK